MKVQLEFKSGMNTIIDMKPSVKLTKNFTLGELANNKGDTALPQFILNAEVDVFLQMLQEFRVWYNKPMTINCCYRQPAYNKLVGGVSNSLHKKALAVDWGITGFTEVQYKNCADYWKTICTRHGIIGECNFYVWGLHLGAYADKNGYRTFQCRDYRKPTSKSNYTLVALQVE